MSRSLSSAALDSAYLAAELEREREWEARQSRDLILPVRSLRSGLEGLKGSALSAGAAFKRAVGGDATELEQDARLAQARASGMRGDTPTLHTADSLGDYGAVAADWVFSNLPLMAATAPFGLAGGVAGRAAAGSAAARAAVAGRAGSTAARKAGIRAATAQRAARAAAPAAERAKMASTAEAAGAARHAATLGRGEAWGGAMGAAVPYSTATIGENYSRLLNDPEAEGTPAAHGRAAILAGGAAAALGVGPLGNLMSRLGSGAAKGLGGAAATVGTTAVGEGITEAGEQAIGRFQHGLFNENVNMFDADARAEYLEAALAGAVVGGTYASPMALTQGLAGDRVREKIQEEKAKTESGLSTRQDAPDQSTGPDPYAALNETTDEELQRRRRGMRFAGAPPDPFDADPFDADPTPGDPQDLVHPMRALNVHERAWFESLDDTEKAQFEAMPPEFRPTYQAIVKRDGEGGPVIPEWTKAARQTYVQDLAGQLRWWNAVGATADARLRGQQGDASQTPESQGTNTRYYRPLEEEAQDPDRLNMQRGQDSLSLPADLINGRVIYNGKAIPGRRLWEFAESRGFDLADPENKRELFALADKASTYAAPANTSNRASQTTVFTFTPREATSYSYDRHTSELVPGDKVFDEAPERRAARQRALADLINQRGDGRTAAPVGPGDVGQVAVRESTMDRERPILDKINTFLQDELGLESGLQIAEIEESHELSTSGRVSTREQNALGVQALTDHFSDLGMQPVAAANGRFYFAPVEAVEPLLKKFNIPVTRDAEGALTYSPEDLSQVLSLGSMIGRPGAQAGKLRVRNMTGSFTNNENDGTVAITNSIVAQDPNRPMQQVTGLIERPDGKGGTTWALSKGIARGALDLGQFGTESEGVNTDLSLGQKLQKNDEMQLSRLQELGRSKATMSLQAVLAGMKDPAAFIRQSTGREIEGRSALDELSPGRQELLNENVPPGLLVGDRGTAPFKQFDIVGSRGTLLGSQQLPSTATSDGRFALRKAVIDRARGQVRGSSQANDGAALQQRMEELDRTFGTRFSTDPEFTAPGAMLLPGTARELAARYKEETGQELRVGDLIVLHREPALPNASSMMPYVYLGEAKFSQASQEVNNEQYAVVVHPSEQASLGPQGADFDGDAVLAIHPAGQFELRGYAGDAQTEAGAKSLVTGQMLTAAQPGGEPGPNRTARVLRNTMTGFSNRIGDIAVLGNKLREAGILTSTPKAAEARQQIDRLQKSIAARLAEVDEAQRPEDQVLRDLQQSLDAIVNDPERSIEQSVQELENQIALIAQTSISAKKKAVLEREAMKVWDALNKQVRDARRLRYRVPASLLQGQDRSTLRRTFTPEYAQALDEYRQAYDRLQQSWGEDIAAARKALFEAAGRLYDLNATPAVDGTRARGDTIPASALTEKAQKDITLRPGKRFTDRVRGAGQSKFREAGRGTITSVKESRNPDFYEVEYVLDSAEDLATRKVLVNKKTHALIGRGKGKGIQERSFLFDPDALDNYNSIGTLSFLSEGINALKHTGSREFKLHAKQTGTTSDSYQERRWRADQLRRLAEHVLEAPMTDIEAALAERVLAELDRQAETGFYQAEQFRLPVELLNIAKEYMISEADQLNSEMPPGPADPNATESEKRMRAARLKDAAIAQRYPMYTAWLQEQTKKYNALGRQLHKERAGSNSNETEAQWMQDQRRSIRQAIETLYRLGHITTAQLVAHAPDKLVAQLVAAPDLAKMRRDVIENSSPERLEELGIDPQGARQVDVALVDKPAQEAVFQLGNGEWGAFPEDMIPPGVYDIDAELSTPEALAEGHVYLKSSTLDANGERLPVRAKLILQKASTSREFPVLQRFLFDAKGTTLRRTQLRIRRASLANSKRGSGRMSRYMIGEVKEQTQAEVSIPGVTPRTSSANITSDPVYRSKLTPEREAILDSARATLSPDNGFAQTAQERLKLEGELLRGNEGFLKWLGDNFGLKPGELPQIAKAVFGENFARIGASPTGVVLYIDDVPVGAKRAARDGRNANWTWKGLTLRPMPNTALSSDPESTKPLRFAVDAGQVIRAYRNGELKKSEGAKGQFTRDLNAAKIPLSQRRLHVMAQRIVDQLGGLLGLPAGIQIVSREKATELARERLGDDAADAVAHHRKLGFYDRVTNSLYLDFARLDARKNRAALVAALGHEIGHALLDAHFSTLPKQLQRQMIEEYTTWARSHGAVFGTEVDELGAPRATGVSRPVSVNHVRQSRVAASMQSWYGPSRDGRAKVVRPEAERAALLEKGELTEEQARAELESLFDLFDFHEWVADNVGRWLHEEAVKPESPVQSALQRIAHMIKALFKQLREAFGAPPAASVDAFVRELMDRHTSEVARRSQTLPAEAAPQAKTKAKAETKAKAKTPKAKREYSQTTEEAVKSWIAATSAGVLSHPVEAAEQVMETLSTHLNARDLQLLRRAAMSPAMQLQMRTVLNDNLEAKRAIRTDVNAAAAWLYVLNRMGVIQTGPQTKGVMNRFNRGMDKLRAETFGEMSEFNRTETLLQVLSENPGATSEQVLDPAAPQVSKLRKRIMEGLGKAYQKTVPAYDYVMEFMSKRLEETRIPSLIALSRQVDLQPWNAEGGEAPYLERVRVESVRYLQELNDSTGMQEYINDTDMQRRIWDIATDPDAREAAEAAFHARRDSATDQRTVRAWKHYRRIRKHLDRMLHYLQHAGVKVNKENNYFPLLWDADKVGAGREKLIEHFQKDKFGDKWTELQEVQRTAAEERGDQEEQSRLAKMTWKEFAADVAGRLGEEGVTNLRTDRARNPGFQFEHGRSLGFLVSGSNVTASERDFVRGFFNQNVPFIVAKYTRAAVKRAEFDRVFGHDGKKLQALLDKAREEGATDKQIQMAIDSVDMLTGMYGARTKDHINKIAQALPVGDTMRKKLTDTTSGTTHRSVQGFSQWAITYENLRTLTTQVFASAIDPVGATVRGESLGTTVRAFHQTFRRIFKQMSPEELTRYEVQLRRFGTTQHAASLDVLMQDYYNLEMDWLPKKINEWFFKANLSEGMTKFSREIATNAAEDRIIAWAEAAKKGDKKAARHLRDLNLKPDEVKADADGRVKLLNAGERRRAERRGDDAALDRDFRLRAAVHRFTDQSSVRPGAHTRSEMANDAHFALIFHLRTFAMAFHHSILARTFDEAVTHQNYRPLVTMAALFIPIMLVADWLRDWLKYGEEGAYWKRDWEWSDHVNHAIIRAGFAGKDEIYLRALDELMQGNVTDAVASGLGVTASHVNKIAKYGFSEADLPFQDLWRNWG